MADKCIVCSRDVTGSKCSYCGFTSVETLDEYGDKIEAERANQYRKDVLNNITDFHILAHTYRWDSSSAKVESGRIKVDIADGSDCFNRIAWSKSTFGQNLDDTNALRELTVSYLVGGKKKDIKIKIKPIKCDDYWKFGVKINNDLTVSFYLGTEKNNSVAGPYDLDLL